MTPKPATCAALTTAGQPCHAAPVLGSDRCIMHATDPVVVQLRDDARRAGGEARAGRAVLSEEEARGIELADPRRVPLTLERVGRWVATGKLDVKIANALAVLASTAVRAADSADLARRLETLEGVLHRRVG